ncbi:hypothetical protein ACN4EG_15310 [Alkalinema pantanalense CENA528]|uniref:hypothetical protein n=1 Tax=Alkalinema pantanalense TaxID=1620705 RepID=UPI003D6F8B1D
MWNYRPSIARQLFTMPLGCLLSSLTLIACSAPPKTSASSNPVPPQPQTTTVATAAPIESNSNPESEPVSASVDQKEKSQEKSETSIELYDGRNVTYKEEAAVSGIARSMVNKAVSEDKEKIRPHNQFDCDLDLPSRFSPDSNGPGTEGVSIIGRAEGSFTRPNTNQSAFLYTLCESGRTFGLGGILILENETVVAHYLYGENGLMYGMLSAPDVNQNGLTELMLTFGGLNQGYAGRGISLFELGNGNLTFLGRESTYSDNSGAMLDRSKVETFAYRLWVEPAASPRFLKDTYKNAQLITQSEPISLSQVEPGKFIKLR